MTRKNIPGQGRIKKPTKLKMLEGNPGCRPLHPELEPQPKVGIPDPPEWLNEPGLQEWRRITEHLFDLGLLTEIDFAALCAYCQSWGRWVELEKKMFSQPLIGLDKEGIVRKNPHLSTIWKEMQNVWKYLSAFGMSPSARAGLAVTKKESTEDLWRKFAEMTRVRKSEQKEKRESKKKTSSA